MVSAKQTVSDVRPYVERALRDEELRENLRNAFYAARDVYEELLGPRGATAMAVRVARDKQIQHDLRQIADELRSAGERVRGTDDHTGRNILLLATGVAIGLLFNPVSGPATRKWVKHKMLGGEPDFAYTGGNSGSSAA